MKRIFSFIAVLIVLFCFLSISVQATDLTVQIEYLPDGSYFITETQMRMSRMLTKVGSKTATYYSADDIIQWKMFITAEFLYDGTSCTCTYVSGTTTIYNTSNWRKTYDNSSSNANTATYTAEFDHSALGVVIGSRTYTLTVTCDENGNIS